MHLGGLLPGGTTLAGHSTGASQARELAGLKTNHSPSVGFQLEQVPGLVEHGAVRGQAPTTQGDGGTL